MLPRSFGARVGEFTSLVPPEQYFTDQACGSRVTTSVSYVAIGVILFYAAHSARRSSESWIGTHFTNLNSGLACTIPKPAKRFERNRQGAQPVIVCGMALATVVLE